MRKRVMGFEPTTFTLATCKPTETRPCAGKDLAPPSPPPRSACAARSTPNQTKKDQMDPDLAALIRAWPHLPRAIRTGFMAMIDAVAVTESPPICKEGPDAR